VNTIRARVVVNRCLECRNELLWDCQESGLPPPTSEINVMPATWGSHECHHLRGVFILKVEGPVLDDPSRETEFDEESLRCKEGNEIEPPAWSNNLDATKNIGYPARETGRYGSYPSHDGFDDESKA
jgi:hypothetical protein